MALNGQCPAVEIGIAANQRQPDLPRLQPLRQRDAVDAHVLAMFGTMLGELTAGDLFDPGAASSLADAVVRHLPPDSPVPGYLRRLLLAGGDRGRELFRRLYEESRTALACSTSRMSSVC